MRRGILLATGLAFALPVSARAQGGSWSELAFFVAKDASGSAIALSPVSGGRFELVDPVWGESAFGFAFNIFSGSAGGVVFAPGNLYLGLAGVGGDEALFFWGGGGATIPIASSQGGNAAALAVSEAMRGRWDAWLWAPSRLSLVVRGGVRHHREDGFTLGGELGLGWMIWFGAGQRDPLLAFQIAGEGGYRVSAKLSFGGRLAAVAGTTPLGHSDALQISLEPFVRLHGAGRVVYELRLTVPLDAPYGFAFSQGGIWGLRLGGGVVF